MDWVIRGLAIIGIVLALVSLWNIGAWPFRRD